MPDFRVDAAFETSVDASHSKLLAWDARPTIEPRLKLQIRHSCRVRPFLPHEAEDEEATRITNALRYIDPALPIEDSLKGDFASIFDEQSTNEDVFEKFGREACDQVLRGNNSILIAYGQVGTGKTQSILGDKGLVPQSLDYLLRKNASVEAKACEVFGVGPSTNSFDLMTDSERVRTFDSATSKKINTPHCGEEFLESVQSKLHLTTNTASSRGHTIYQLETGSGWLLIVDLAGCDGQDEDGARVSINRGLRDLTTQFQMISQLGRIHKSQISTPQSELMRMLMPKLEASANMYMLYHFDPKYSMKTGSQRTMDFASSVLKCNGLSEGQVRQVQLEMVEKYLNDVRADETQLEKENKALEGKVAQMKSETDDANKNQQDLKSEIDAKAETLKALSDEQAELEKQLESAREEAEKAVERATELEEMHVRDMEEIQRLEKSNDQIKEDEKKLKEDMAQKKEDLRKRLVQAEEQEIPLHEDSKFERKELKKLKSWNCACCTYRQPKKPSSK